MDHQREISSKEAIYNTVWYGNEMKHFMLFLINMYKEILIVFDYTDHKKNIKAAQQRRRNAKTYSCVDIV